MPRTPQDPSIRMNEILDVADYLFFTKGYDATTINDITKKMGVAQGMLYYYFKSKEEILEKMLDRHADSLMNEIKTIIDLNSSPTEKISLTLSNVLRKATYKDGLLLNLLYDNQNLNLKVQLFRQLELTLSPWLLKIIEDGLSRQVFHTKHAPTTVSYILVILEFLSEALYQKTTADILAFRLQMAESLVEKALDCKDNTIHILL
ncbi:transcriptional regulator, TetR family [Propionispira arboris]|uniref:Transcriptional regulator, TetR family n=1 Tax=Propionispira arboris TaxID=84035 RepID=A0A1H7C2A1_9FIRM|nr:TetR/AcrR family transcriptional regulator [Propionispira arboris]SEJ82687.1 transcriptional regulator, TetR family [Propionispira arboris]